MTRKARKPQVVVEKIDDSWLLELDRKYGREVRQTGDMDIQQFSARWHVSEMTASDRLRKAVDDGYLVCVKVQDPDRQNPIRVWRPTNKFISNAVRGRKEVTGDD